jgi:hypothetical protein
MYIAQARRMCLETPRSKSFPDAQEMKTIRHHPGWQSALDIFSSPYFRRTWIIQEVAACSSLRAVYSGIPIPWGTLAVAAEDIFITLEHIGQDIQNREATTISLMTAWMFLQGMTKLHELKVDQQLRVSLAFLLESLVSKHAEATDPRDKIYALLSVR